MTLKNTVAIQVPQREIEQFCQRFGVEQLALFGSVLRDDFGPESDVDVLLKFKPGHGFTFENTPDIDDELRRIFGRPVDVLEMGRIRNPLRRRTIMSNHRVIYGG
jgi:predicted nucleotidyltransferase